jgi:hypothetical protein
MFLIAELNWRFYFETLLFFIVPCRGEQCSPAITHYHSENNLNTRVHLREHCSPLHFNAYIFNSFK